MKGLIFLFLLALVKVAGAQTILETNPTSLRWKQLNTPNFRIVFPTGFEFQAQRMANTFEHIRESESKSMGGVPKRISVILQNQSAVSNGFVSMFPRRSEFFTMPSQNYNFTGTNDWLNLLVSHEYRHVVQYQNATRGFNKLFLYLFGSPTFAAMAHAAAPDWFWEGDAVVTETAFTPSGRGKIPNFGLVFKSNLVTGRTFNYHKQYLRSYKDNIPNHYVLGYYMVSYLRIRTGDPDIWEKISARAWRVPFIPFAFSNAIHKQTGLRVTKLYDEMAKDLSDKWQAKIDSISVSPFETIIKPDSKAYTDFSFPQPQEDGSIIALKEGIGTIATFVAVRKGQEEKIFTPGYMNDTGMLSANATAIVWTEYGYDPRWQVRNYSLIKAYDRKSGKRLLAKEKKLRLAGASISPDSRYVVTVESSTDYIHKILIISYSTGKIEKEFSNPANHFFSMPRWSADGKKIIILKTTPSGKTISIIDPSSGSQEDVLPITHENLGHPILYGDYVLFNSASTGIDNIHAYDLVTKKRFVVTSSKFGAYNPAVSNDGKFLYYNDQTTDGLAIVRIPFEPAQWKPYPEKNEIAAEYTNLVEQEGGVSLFESIPANNYPVAPFQKWKHAINPFSWGAYVDNDLANIDIGISSRDILSTTAITAGYSYDIKEETGFWKAGLSYQGFYPIIDGTYTNGSRKDDVASVTTYVVQKNDTTTYVNDVVFKWDEQNVSAGLRIPLNLTQSKYSTGITLSNYVGLTAVRNFDNGFNNGRYFPVLITDDEVYVRYYLNYVGNGTLFYNYSNLSAYRLLKRSRRDIISKWGQSINLKYYSTPYGGDFKGGVASAVGYLYFPGVIEHHSFYVSGSYQHYFNSPYDVDNQRDYYFRNTVPVPRGFSLPRYNDYYGASVNYTLPLWYPDIAIGPVLNLQRFRLNVFADYGFGDTSYSATRSSKSYTSVGGELKLDFNFMRLLPQIDVGVRFSYGIDPSAQKFELVIGTINF